MDVRSNTDFARISRFPTEGMCGSITGVDGKIQFGFVTGEYFAPVADPVNVLTCKCCEPAGHIQRRPASGFHAGTAEISEKIKNI